MKNVIETFEKHPAVRFGLPVVAVVACTLLKRLLEERAYH